MSLDNAHPSQVKGGAALPSPGAPPSLPDFSHRSDALPQWKTFCTTNFNEVVIKECRRSIFQIKPILFLNGAGVCKSQLQE